MAENQLKWIPKSELNARTLSMSDYAAINSTIEKDMQTAQKMRDAGRIQDFQKFVFGGRIGKNSKLWRKMILEQDPQEKERLLVYARSFRGAILKTGMWKPKVKTDMPRRTF